MAHIFKHPENGRKGIIVFTHKEFKVFNYEFKIRKKNLLRTLSFFKNTYTHFILARRFSQMIEAISRNYFIGIHWGFYQEGVTSPDWVDFHMASPSTVTFKNSPFLIPLNSSNFTPSLMKKNNRDKYWDIIVVAKNDSNKKYPELMNSIRRLYDSGFMYRVLFIVASNKEESARKYYVEIFDDYNKMFSAKERELFTIIKTHPETGFQGLSYSTLSNFYNTSKIFTIFSQKEGGCKVIKEAQLCGMPIVVKSDLSGGGRDYLNERNSVFFDDYDCAHESLIYAVENYETFSVDTKSLEKEIGENSSIEKLKDYLKIIFENNNQNFDGNLINVDSLNRRLPAHYFDSSIVWASDSCFRFSTTDIVNSKMLQAFFEELRVN